MISEIGWEVIYNFIGKDNQTCDQIYIPFIQLSVYERYCHNILSSWNDKSKL